MRIDFANEEILAALIRRHRPMKYCKLDDGRYLFSDEGIVAYVLNEKEIYFSLDKCQPYDFPYLRENAPAINREHILSKTPDVRVGKHAALLTRLKAASWDTFVDMDLLEAFDHPNFYQDKCPGIIAVTEGPAGFATEVLRGYVMPVRTGMEKDGYYNDRATTEQREG